MTTERTSGISRRTLAKGAAWAVPAVAVTAAAPAHAVSLPPPPPPPVFNWSGGCATVGNGAGGCNGAQKTPQVPVYAINNTPQTLQFQIPGAKLWLDNETKPTNYTTPQLWTNNGTEDNCGPQVTATGCDGYLTVTLAPGACIDLWIVGSTSLGNSSAFWAEFQYRFVISPTPTPALPAVACAVVLEGIALAPAIIPSNNCDGSAVTLSCSSTRRLQAPAQEVSVQSDGTEPTLQTQSDLVTPEGTEAKAAADAQAAADKAAADAQAAADKAAADAQAAADKAAADKAAADKAAADKAAADKAAADKAAEEAAKAATEVTPTPSAGEVLG